MSFFPYLEDLEEAVMFVVNTITKSMQSIPTVQVYCTKAVFVMHVQWCLLYILF